MERLIKIAEAAGRLCDARAGDCCGAVAAGAVLALLSRGGSDGAFFQAAGAAMVVAGTLALAAGVGYRRFRG